tara:strand:+ start:19006 stop:19182 length:177 start_codon:yes stop_codon:yes gene_type:complete
MLPAVEATLSNADLDGQDGGTTFGSFWSWLFRRARLVLALWGYCLGFWSKHGSDDYWL